MSFPADPIAAVSHPDPYPYYADLVARKPMYRDFALGMWTASSAAAVGAVLTSDLCRVRPLAERVPASLAGSVAADLFRYRVRVTDGEAHSRLKEAVAGALGSLDQTVVGRHAAACARPLVAKLGYGDPASGITDFMFKLPLYTVASLLGFEQAELQEVASDVSRFMPCIGSISDPARVEQGKAAAPGLLARFRRLLPEDPAKAQADGLLSNFALRASEAGQRDPDILAANALGFLTQAYEATAGLIGSTLVVLARRPELLGRVRASGGMLHDVLLEVLRYDPPIQNTRRFVVGDGVIAGAEVKTGDTILAILAAANRDPALGRDAGGFDPSRPKDRMFSFGAGVHSCPGNALATTIAQTGVAELLASGMDLSALANRVSYRPSGNARVPLFMAEASARVLASSW